MDDYDDDDMGGADDAFRDVIDLLRRRGIKLPPSTTADTFVDSLRTALHALAGQKANGNGGRSTRDRDYDADQSEVSYSGEPATTLSLASARPYRRKRVSDAEITRLAASVSKPPRRGA